MPKPTNVQKNPDQWVITVGSGNLATASELKKMLAEVDTSLEWIRDQIIEGRGDNFALNLLVELQASDHDLVSDISSDFQWHAPKLREEWGFPPPDQVDYSEVAFEPWTVENRRFWIEVANIESLRADVFALLQKMEELVRLGQSVETSMWGLWEVDEVQFGEIPAMVLAEHCRAFVPYYTKLLRCWDMDHEVLQLEAIDRIVRAHGICPETEELLFARIAENPGQHGRDQIDNLFPFLQGHYGNFVKSKLFVDVITHIHENERPEFVDHRVFEYSEFDELKDGENEIRSKLADPTNSG